ncbi:MAG: DUF3604 domain-containing protein [Rhodobiaceae bacterium]|nr:DUF3604 domain-containing protein [Rhodobiaceae bacterium]
MGKSSKLALLLALLAAPIGANSAENRQNREVLFGETHLHTVMSFDAYIFGNRNSPEDAYRFAKGETIKHPAGFDMTLSEPLDFQSVTDHAIYLGMLPAMHNPKLKVSKHPISLEMRKAKSAVERLNAFQKLFPYLNKSGKPDDLVDVDVMKSAWSEIIASANRHNDPGKFTTLIGYEFTSGPKNQNLHRNVFFRGDQAPTLPFSRIMSPNPEDLWKWMDKLRAKGMDSLAVPHNSNGSNGLMFQTTKWDGSPMDMAYAKARMRNEPIVEVTQVKGDSETHPLLSPNDEYADFETMPFRIGAWVPSKADGSYVRQAYRRGLEMAAQGKGNPYKFGLIGASDTHVGAGAFEEDNYWSKVGLVDSNAKLRGSVPLDKPNKDGSLYNENNFQTWSASGLAAVWADSNTRGDIFDAMRRKETYATTGPRMKLRFFASDNFERRILKRANMVERAYRQGVSMGSDLSLDKNQSPEFLLWAMRDARSQGLQRLQIVKGWVKADGSSAEKVFDVACAGAKSPNAKHRCPNNGAKVDVKTCRASAKTSANELKTTWRDPEYTSGQQAFYYVRVLENPSCRWSSWDALRAGVAPRPDVDATLQERAYSSPIWVN